MAYRDSIIVWIVTGDSPDDRRVVTECSTWHEALPFLPNEKSDPWTLAIRTDWQGIHVVISRPRLTHLEDLEVRLSAPRGVVEER